MSDLRYWHRSGWWRTGGLPQSSGELSLDRSASSCSDRSHLNTRFTQYQTLFVFLFYLFVRICVFFNLRCEVHRRGRSLFRSWRSSKWDNQRPRNDHRSLSEPYSLPEAGEERQVRQTDETDRWGETGVSATPLCETFKIWLYLYWTRLYQNVKLLMCMTSHRLKTH